eukprot:2167526-Rhodomonas_salina.1
MRAAPESDASRARERESAAHMGRRAGARRVERWRRGEEEGGSRECCLRGGLMGVSLSLPFPLLSLPPPSPEQQPGVRELQTEQRDERARGARGTREREARCWCCGAS